MLKWFYNLFSYLFEAILPLLQFVSPKMKLFVLGRRDSQKIIKHWDSTDKEWFWFHCASLGEFEQALPLIEKLKIETRSKILVTFFSPSGYEQKKAHKLLDAVLYLPIDTPKNAKQFVKQIQPKAAFFVKYEFWENYFQELEKEQIPIYMVSAAFRENQIYFKWYGSFFKNTLKRVTYFFVQNKISKTILNKNGFENVTISGDTRFDRVYAQLSMDNQLDFMEEFIQNRMCMVLGSTWPACETFFVDAINNAPKNVCFVIAPHEIKPEKIATLKQKLKVETSVFSEGVSRDSKVLIIDAIGYLTKIYSYANIAYVGGAVGTTGLHNILEPAVFGVPILVGSNVEKFPEAKHLERFGGLKIVASKNEFLASLKEIVSNEVLRNKMANASSNFVAENVGATQRIAQSIST